MLSIYIQGQTYIDETRMKQELTDDDRDKTLALLKDFGIKLKAIPEHITTVIQLTIWRKATIKQYLENYVTMSNIPKGKRHKMA